MWIPPLLVIPLLIYNAVHFGLVGERGLAWAQPVFTLNMPSGAVWGVNLGDCLIVFALVLLVIEGFRARQLHIPPLWGSSLVFLAYVGEFLLLPAASTSVFFICLAISFVDASTNVFFKARSGHIRDDFD